MHHINWFLICARRSSIYFFPLFLLNINRHKAFCTVCMYLRALMNCRTCAWCFLLAGCKFPWISLSSFSSAYTRARSNYSTYKSFAFVRGLVNFNCRSKLSSGFYEFPSMLLAQHLFLFFLSVCFQRFCNAHSGRHKYLQMRIDKQRKTYECNANKEDFFK